MFKNVLTVALVSAILAASASVCAADEGQIAPTLATATTAPVSLDEGLVVAEYKTTADELLSCFADREGVTLTDGAGRALERTDIVPTGAIVSGAGESATVIIPGDTNADAKIGVRDVVGILRLMAGKADIPARAADVDGDGAVNAKDVIKLMRYLVGWDDTLSSFVERAEHEDEDLGMYFASSMLRIAREDTATHGNSRGVIRMAKNEYECAQIVVTSTSARKNLTLEVGELVGDSGDVLEKEVRYGHYYNSQMFNDLDSFDIYNTTTGYWADPYPMLVDSFGVGAGESQSFLVKVKTSAETPAGWYGAPVVVRDSAGNEIKRSTLYVYVWDFALDTAPACRTLFGGSSWGLAAYFGIGDAAAWDPIFEQWYEYALENRMTLQFLPYDVTDSRADKYMSDERVTAFITLSGREADVFAEDRFDYTANNLRATYNKLQTNPEWAKKAYIYTVDEPWGESGYEIIKFQHESVERILGDTPYKIIAPGGVNWVSSLGSDLFELCSDYITTVCPSANAFTRFGDSKMQLADPINYPTWGDYQDRAQYRKYGDFEPRYRARVDAGESGDAWWYVCVEYPYANIMNSYQGAWNRVPLWQQYRYDVDGMLHWDITMWLVDEHGGGKINLRRTNNGTGMLIYPGTLWGEGPLPVPSVRMENVRDGIEDFQYMTQLERSVGRDSVMQRYCARIAPDVVVFEKNYDGIERVREEMGFELERIGG